MSANFQNLNPNSKSASTKVLLDATSSLNEIGIFIQLDLHFIPQYAGGVGRGIRRPRLSPSPFFAFRGAKLVRGIGGTARCSPAPRVVPSRKRDGADPCGPLPDSSSSAITVARCRSSCLPSSAMTECNSVSRSSCRAACCSARCSERAAWTSARISAASAVSRARVAATSREFSSATSDRREESAAA